MAKFNPMYDAAHKITEMMNPDARLRQSTFKMNMKHLSILCGNKAKESGETVYDYEDVVEAFGLLKAELDAKGMSCNLLTLLKGTPQKNIDRLLAIPESPAVYDSSAYDEWVRKYARRLKKIGWKYNGWATIDDQFNGRRMSYEEAKGLGLVE